jgi:hypothetical protein
VRKEVRELRAYLAECTDGQVKSAYERELAAGRVECADLALREGRKRGLAFVHELEGETEAELVLGGRLDNVG